MTSEAQARLMEQLTRLPDEVFLRRDDAAIGGLSAAVLASGFQGLRLSGPRAAPLDGAGGLPLLLLAAQTPARRAAVDLHRNAIAVATDVDSGAVYVGNAFPGNDEKSPGAPPNKVPAEPLPPEPVPADPALWAQLGAGNTAGSTWLDFQQLAHLPARAGRWAMRVISYDQASNPVYVQAGPKPSDAPALKRDQALATMARLREVGKRPPGLPSFVRVPETPVLGANGVDLHLTRREAGIGDGPIAIHAALRIPIAGARIVVPGAVIGTGPALPTVIVKATLLLVFKDNDMPIVVPVEVPLWIEQGAQAGLVVDAAFSVDLAAHLPKSPRPGVCQVFLVAGPYAAGPYALTLR